MNIVIERKLPSDADYIPIVTQNFNGSFINRMFSYNDSLNDYTGGVDISYRLKMNIGTDTSFYVDSVTLFYTNQCNPVTERKICPGTSTYFSVDSLTGYNYKWQVDAGSGFTDIVNNSIYSGANGRTLILNNVPENFYGYQYRCVQTNGTNTIHSTPVTLKFSSTWTGSVSTAWEDNNNWSCGIVPDQYIDVIIKNNISNYPVVNSNATCHSLRAAPGVSVVINNGIKLDISGP